MFEKNLEINYLLDFYGEVLSDRKRGILEMYYNDDYSLSEIADDIGISRQGVRDIIKKTSCLARDIRRLNLQQIKGVRR